MADNPIGKLTYKRLRRNAAEALRDSRKKDRPIAEQQSDREVAKAYKDLAEHTAWRDGEKPRDS